MGMADLIPGVSGGTVAFISGIYEELLYSIKKVSGEVIKLFLKRKFKKAFAEIPFGFLIPLGAGLLTAVITLSRFLSFLLQTYPIFIWSLFFGLVLASTWLVAKRVKKWKPGYLIAFLITAIAAYFIVGAVPVETPTTLPIFFLSGVIAIIAMILPGISGSFILLLLGKYGQVLEAAKNLDMAVLFSVLAGAVVGLSIFSRVLTWLFERYHNISVAILAGFMFGSVRKLWPWKEVILSRTNSHGELVPIIEKNILPSQFDASTIFALALMILGVGIVIYLNKLKLVEEHSDDIS